MFYNYLEKKLEDLKLQDNFRELKSHKNNYILNFSSNDYLNLNSDRELKNNFLESINIEEISFGSSGSRLLGGNYNEIINFEESIDKIFKKKSLVFNSGYDANTTVLETFYKKGDVVFTDRYNHASIYDGALHSGVKIIRYKHLDYQDLEKKLKKHRNSYENSLIITESIYSMDGDIVDLNEIIRLKNEFNSQCYLDEAHSYGVLGYGLAYSHSVVEEIDFIMLGLGKGGGSNGGILILNNISKEYIVNKGRKFIYTTSSSPIQTSWNHYIFKKIPDFKEKRKKLELLKLLVYKKLKEKNIDTISSEQIISIVIGDNKKTIDLAQKLGEKGYLVHPIKEPTVPKGRSCLRLTLNSNMEYKDIIIFIEELSNELKNDNKI